ncbi:RNA polymerase sigma-I factor [Vulcanibacillus modesticaldus]|uniref:RNA polymerase sigma-I factor n=1 Tax=Vulcanibacillus modesticaldus TaxID=337097 RepID=UPI00159F1AC9|nr:RNA polymerase sigma-I factor [Vulcanibacillus modesticaldus]
MINVEELIYSIQNGSERDREKLIEMYKPQILYWTSNLCKRKLDWTNDELSIALMAFNDAIDSFEVKKGANFSTYAKIVIKHRLIDYFKKEQKHRHLSLTIVDEEETEFTPAEIKLATENYYKELERIERVEELQLYQKKLSEFGISFIELTKHSPKHKDTRKRLTYAAQCLVSDINLVKKFQRTKQLPIKELILMTGLSRKVLETGRKYVVAVSLILLNKEFKHLRSFIEIGGDGCEG